MTPPRRAPAPAPATDPATHATPAPAGRAAKLASWGLSLALAGAAAAAPALAEAQVRQQLRDRLGAEHGFAIDVDFGGLELHGIDRTLPDGRGHLRIDHLRVRPGLDGFVIELDGLDGQLRRRPAPDRAPTGRPAAAASSRSVEGRVDPLTTALGRLRGIPIEVIGHGQIRIELGDGVEAVAHDLGLSLPGDGRLLGRSVVDLGDANPANPEGETWATATLELSAIDERPRDLDLRGQLQVLGSDTALTLTGRYAGARASLSLDEPSGGHAEVALDRDVEPGRDRLTLTAERLPLAVLAPLAQRSGTRVAAALGERDGRVELGDASLDGRVELTRGAGLTRARLDQVELRDLTITSDLLAAEPVVFRSLIVDGELAREHTPAGPRSSGQLTVDHAGVAMQLSGQLDAGSLVFDAELPTTSCQAVLDALPGAPAALAGTELRGQLDAHFGLTLDFAALAAARARYLGPEAEPIELETFAAPGELRFDLPYLDRCEVVRLGPGVDVGGLAGPYHHRFATGSGAEKRRVMAPGDAQFVSLASVPQLALAFVILEDARYWRHDGFDREQIERAFWYNVLEGRVSRGASTITQQAARSLWLGVDRSLARKLAEAMLAAELERSLDKRRILELYLNIIELGPEVHGVAEAADYHFGKRPEDLTLIQALHLASMAPAPVAYSRRFADGQLDEAWSDHLRQQVRRLKIRHLISEQEAQQASRLELNLRAHPRTPS